MFRLKKSLVENGIIEFKIPIDFRIKEYKERVKQDADYNFMLAEIADREIPPIDSVILDHRIPMMEQEMSKAIEKHCLIVNVPEKAIASQDQTWIENKVREIYRAKVPSARPNHIVRVFRKREGEGQGPLNLRYIYIVTQNKQIRDAVWNALNSESKQFAVNAFIRPEYTKSQDLFDTWLRKVAKEWNSQRPNSFYVRNLRILSKTLH